MYASFGGVSVAGYGRSLEVNQQAADIDVTTYGDANQEFIAGVVGRSATLQILDDNASSTVRTKFSPGSSGTLIWAPIGTTTGNPKFTVGTAVVTEANVSYPYDDAVVISVTMRLSGAVTEGTY
jgi:predicted secreted protein